jgi:hypothetical protein
MEENISGLAFKVKLAEGAYLVAFVASLVMIVAHTNMTVWAITLGSAVALRILVTQPLRAKLAASAANRARVHDRILVVEQVESHLESKHNFN